MSSNLYGFRRTLSTVGPRVIVLREVRVIASRLGLKGSLLALAVTACLAAHASAEQPVLEILYTPVKRAQVAIWVEDGAGTYLTTVALTEAVAFRGIGNRPGASLMNSGYRWPYGRREGALPIWAHRRASAPGATLFPRVIFQQRVEGFASQTKSDQSKDDYYCLQFAEEKSREDQLDAVSCATQFSSDKGRYATQADLDNGYAEPWETAAVGGQAPSASMLMLPLGSVYPPRMDATPCELDGTCYDHPDLARYGDDARAVMPEIDAVSRATAPGDVPQRILFSVPSSWSKGEYTLWLEINVEGDDNLASTWNDQAYPSPDQPSEAWDYYAKAYGYPYRGQPSIAYQVRFELDAAGDKSFSAELPAGRSSWEHWAPGFGQLEPVSFETGDPLSIAADNGSGADRLRRNADGQRVVVVTRVVDPLAEPTQAPTTPDSTPSGGTSAPADAGTATPADAAEGPAAEPERDASDTSAGRDGDASSPDEPNESPHEQTSDSVGAIEELDLARYPDELRAHSWVELRFRVPHSERKLFAYEVRVATEPIRDEATFIRRGRPAKNATDDPEGATALTVPVDAEAGEWVTTTIGDLIADTEYYVAVRATDEANQHGPISVAKIAMPQRVFATVTPCFIATAAYGSPLAEEIDVLRHVRDRYLLSHAPGRALVALYYEYGPRAAEVIARDDGRRALVRALLRPIVALARELD